MYIYILEGQTDEEAYYVGMTKDPQIRLDKHNAGAVLSTAKHRAWQIQNILWFATPAKATAFEKYLKSGSGRAFARKHP